jgi:hypothetical protein
MQSYKDKVYMYQYSVRDCACNAFGVKYIYGTLPCQPIKKDTTI